MEPVAASHQWVVLHVAYGLFKGWATKEEASFSPKHYWRFLLQGGLWGPAHHEKEVVKVCPVVLCIQTAVQVGDIAPTPDKGDDDNQ